MKIDLAARKNVAGISLTLVSMAIFGYAIYTAHGFRDVSRWFPLGISYVGFALALIVMLWELGIVTAGSSESLEVDATEGDSESSLTAGRGFVVYMAWLIAFAAALMLVGTPLGVFGWLLLFFRLRSKESWLRSVMYALAATFVVVLLGAILHMFLPAGYLIPSGTWVPVVHLKF